MYTGFSDFVQTAKQLAHKYGILEIGTGQILVFIRLEPVTGCTIFRLAVFKDLSWQLEYRGQQLTRDKTAALGSLASLMNSESLERIMEMMVHGSVCKGHRDFAKVKEQCAKNGQLVASDRVTVIAYYSHDTVRSAMCPILMLSPTSSGLCEACGHREFRSNMRARESYLRKQKPASTDSDFSKFTPHGHLSEAQKSQKLKTMCHTVQKLHRKVNSLQKKVEQLLDKESVEVDDTQHQFLSKVCQEKRDEILSQFPEGSAQCLLWEQQLKRLKAKGASGMRWHPTVVRWCISMYIKSPAAYRQLANSGFLYLPSQSTLKSYINFTGINPRC